MLAAALIMRVLGARRFEGHRGARLGLCLLAIALAPACRRGSVGDGRSASNTSTSAPTTTGATPTGAASEGEGDGTAGERREAHVSFAPAVLNSAAPRARAADRAARANETLAIAAGPYHLGSTPGEPSRDPGTEADGVLVPSHGYDIDALPYPNDPSQPVRTGASRDEAAGLCRARGRRLCNELEWERACRGPSETVFPGSDTWEPERCAEGDLSRCATGFGALAMGTRYAEWTADAIDDRAAIRGALANAPAAQHRCAARRTAVPNETGLPIAFRCCGGEAPAFSYPREPSRPPYREETMTTAELARIVETVPELARVREGLSTFNAAAVAEVLNHGATTAQNHPELIFTVNPLRWSPTFGEEVLVFTALSNVGSFVAALWVLPPAQPGGPARYKHAASFILAGDRVAMAFGYGRGTREEFQWSACWNCGGEHGVVLYDREASRVVIVQR